MSVNTEATKPRITLRVKERLWSQFKNTIPRTITLNDAIVNLIREQVTGTQIRIDHSEPPFMDKDGDHYVVLFAKCSKAREFEHEKDAREFLDLVLVSWREDQESRPHESGRTGVGLKFEH